MLKPINRSRARIFLGKKVYRLKRYLQWYLDGKTYATAKQAEPLPYLLFSHKTPLLRRLKDVDMWLQHNKVINLRIAAKTEEFQLVIRVTDTHLIGEWRAVRARHHQQIRKIYRRNQDNREF